MKEKTRRIGEGGKGGRSEEDQEGCFGRTMERFLGR